MKQPFVSAGHLSTLIAYFDLSCAFRMQFRSLVVFIAQNLHLDPRQKGLIVAVPVLAGARI